MTRWTTSTPTFLGRPDHIDTGLTEPRSVALMFAVALGDPVKYRQGLERLVMPGSLDRWSGFVRAAEAVQHLGPWHVRGFTAFDVVTPDVAFVGLQAAARPSPIDWRRMLGGTVLITVVRPLGGSARWFVKHLGAASLDAGAGSASAARRYGQPVLTDLYRRQPPMQPLRDHELGTGAGLEATASLHNPNPAGCPDCLRALSDHEAGV